MDNVIRIAKSLSIRIPTEVLCKHFISSFCGLKVLNLLQ